MSASTSSRGLTPPPSSPKHGLLQLQRVPASELAEALKNTGVSTPYNPLLQAVEATGRTRGSSATPILQTAQLSLPSATKTSSMTGGNNCGTQSYSYGPSPTAERSQQISRNLFHDSQPGQSQQPSLSSNQRYPRGSLSNQSPTFNSQKVPRTRSIIDQYHMHLQQQISDMAEKIGKQSGIPSRVMSSFREELRNISDICRRRSVAYLAEFENLAAEHAKLTRLADEKQRLIENVIIERDRAKIERNRLRTQMAGMRRHLEDKMEALETSCAMTVEDLKKELIMKEEQIENKRSLWVQTSSARRARELLSTTPSHEQRTPSKVGPHPTNLMEELVTMKLASDAPKPSLLGDSLAFRSQTATKNSGDIIDSMALVPFKTEEQVAAEFSEKFEKTYTMAEQWVRTHTNIVPKLGSLSDISVPYNSEPYECMLRTCYSKSEGAQMHVANLLKDALGRPMLFLRVLIDYIRDQIWTAKTFTGLDQVCGKGLDNIEESLAVKGLTPENRAELINRQTEIITYILENDRYPAFRSAELAKHSAALRNLLVPLLLKDGDRHCAARDLSKLVVVAFDLSADMLLANRTFVIQFPDTGARFLHTSMVCLDSKIEERPVNLHLRHARVRLTVRPVITIRNDLYRTIEVHPVQRAHVLIIK